MARGGSWHGTRRARGGLAVVGAIWALWTVARVAWWVYTRTCRRRLGIAARYAAQGRPAWALVTGASRGIGFAFCEELADEGFDVVMVARTREPLEAAARTIRDRYGVDAVALPADLADAAGSGDASRALESRITEAFSTRDISLVVCNAGITAREVPGLSTGRRHPVSAPLSLSTAAGLRLWRNWPSHTWRLVAAVRPAAG